VRARSSRDLDGTGRSGDTSAMPVLAIVAAVAFVLIVQWRSMRGL
jgi:hypothetical protein